MAGIFAYTDWVNHQKWGNINWKRYCLLKAYGLIKHIVSQMLHMVSDFIYFSDQKVKNLNNDRSRIVVPI